MFPSPLTKIFSAFFKITGLLFDCLKRFEFSIKKKASCKDLLNPHFSLLPHRMRMKFSNFMHKTVTETC